MVHGPATPPPCGGSGGASSSTTTAFPTAIGVLGSASTHQYFDLVVLRALLGLAQSLQRVQYHMQRFQAQLNDLETVVNCLRAEGEVREASVDSYLQPSATYRSVAQNLNSGRQRI